MPCKIINNSGLEISGFEDMIQSLVSFSQERFGFEKPPTLFLNSDPANAENMLGKTAYYDPENREIHVYTTGRHPKDIMRSISHELVHHNQNCNGQLGGEHYSGEGYAQKDPHMRKMEQEAYLQGNMCFRDWEDRHKKLKKQVYNNWRTNTMSLKEWKNKELFGLLSEKWGFAKNLVTESKEITHMCALKVTHKESGQVGHPIQHTLTESGEISHYTVEFDEVIVENIAVEKLDILVQEEHSHKRDDKKPHNEEKEIVDEEELKNAKKSEFKVEDGPGKGKKNLGVTHDGKLEPNPMESENKQLDEDKESYERIAALEAKPAEELSDAERKELKLLKQYFQMLEQQLDEDEVEESVRGYRKENEPQHASQGGNRVADRLRESIYDRFRKLIK